MTIPTSMTIAVVVAMTISLACHASAVGNQAYGSSAAFRHFLETDKRNYECAAQSAKCFNSRQCCEGLVCAALDANDGNKPEVPGYCVKSKDLQACSVGESGREDECPSAHRCMALGRMGQTYCLPVAMGAQQPDFQEPTRMTDSRRYHGPGASKAFGKLGSTCVTDFDCAPRSDDGTQLMCCQLVNKGRQGTKRICDRVTPISTCTSV